MLDFNSLIDYRFNEDVYRLTEIVRFNNWFKIKQESVAEHSFFVVLFVKMFCDKLNVSDEIKLEALDLAVIHDVPELTTNDITFDAKKAMPKVEQAIEEYERKFIKERFPESYDSFYNEDSLAKMIVKAADILSVVQWAVNEINLGNSTVENILYSARAAFYQSLKKIERKVENADK